MVLFQKKCINKIKIEGITLCDGLMIKMFIVSCMTRVQVMLVVFVVSDFTLFL